MRGDEETSCYVRHPATSMKFRIEIRELRLFRWRYQYPKRRKTNGLSVFVKYMSCSIRWMKVGEPKNDDVLYWCEGMPCSSLSCVVTQLLSASLKEQPTLLINRKHKRTDINGQQRPQQKMNVSSAERDIPKTANARQTLVVINHVGQLARL